MKSSYFVSLVLVAVVILALAAPQADAARAAKKSNPLRGDFEKFSARANRRGGRVLADVCNGTMCGTYCADLMTDINNCGACSKFCDIASSCCNGRCTTMQIDPQNCGACGAACPGTCAEGMCDYGGRVFKPIPAPPVVPVVAP